MTYDEIRSEEIIKTIVMVQGAINKEFPESGLSNIAAQLRGTATSMDAEIKKILKPIIWLRTLSALIGVLFIFFGVTLVYLCFLTVLSHIGALSNLEDFLQGIEAVISSLVLLGGALFFIASSEQKIKRKKALRQFYRLRAITHVIDLHQLKKDPSDTWKSQELTKIEISKYLDYCSNLLNIIGKMAAYYEKDIDDDEVREASFDVENLASNLSRKIWQKIMIIQLSPSRQK